MTEEFLCKSEKSITDLSLMKLMKQNKLRKINNNYYFKKI